MVIVLVGADKFDAEQIAESLREKVASHKVIHGDDTISITASFGVAQLEESMDETQLFKKADEALYRAKEKGRNRVVTA